MKKQRLFSALIAMAFGVMLSGEASAQQTPVTEANYEMPARFTPAKMRTMVGSTMVDPHYLKKSDKFWYSYLTSEGKKWYIVEPSKAKKEPLFSNIEMAAQLSEIVKDPYDAEHLPMFNIYFNEAEDGFFFEVTSSVDMTKEEFEAYQKEQTQREVEPDHKPKSHKKIHYMFYDLASKKVTEVPEYRREKYNPYWASVSPDGNTVIFSRNYNLYWMSGEDLEKAKINEKDSTIVEHQITTDGIKDFAWGGTQYSTLNTEENKNQGVRKGAYITWSPDSKHFALTREDERGVGELWVINNTATPRPTLESYKYAMPGDTVIGTTYLYIFNNETKEHKLIDTHAFKDQTLSISRKPGDKRLRDDVIRPASEWLGDDSKFYISRSSRDLKRIDVCSIDVESGEVTTLVEERMNTSMEERGIKLVNNGKQFIQWSQRSGWANLYMYNADGTLKNRITNGDFHCENVLATDDATQTIYFIANGVAKDENPYYTHIYSVKYDGSGMKLLNEQDFEHNISLDETKKYFIDNYSRVDTTPKSALYDNTGRKIMDLEEADLSRLFAAGYKFPERFEFKAADGITDMYGVMYKPYDFDSTKLYPIIEYVYPGPQTEACNTAFSAAMDRTDRLAQFGFIVITLGNRGGHPSRSKWYHNYGYGNLRDYGLADKKTAVEQLANRFNFIDRSKVGIHGHSGGGFMSTAAMLVYPDFFKVAVSCAGNHQNNIYNRWWSEKHHGVKEQVSDKGDTTFLYSIAKNADLAKNLKGKLMLFTGDIDNNVHPANTITVVNALIRANKRFDMMVLPGQRHAFGDMAEYFFWRMGDYFCENLIGDSKRGETSIPQMSH